ncbi:protein ELF4-LIKE 3-like isoform X2 [Ipomoea triloba]|uniref:protein ELF4-LIKE 3-like isoform X2 n=1 Tax=Ipomoea triloba TaxID=35885 RepID=UPI00125E8827|nr:protein ELF4-LIKE 3-like isoform X2 [Ipomoea triloba]
MYVLCMISGFCSRSFYQFPVGVVLSGQEMDGDTFSGLGNGAQMIDGKVLQTFQKSFVQVQTILDHNRLLISEINQNHESKSPDNLNRNVGLIKELNNNIRKVVDLYAGLSTSFSKNMDASSEGDSSGALRSSDGKGCHKRNRPG